MSREQKRFRQINIQESFALSKKPRNKLPVPSMEDNLRELMVAATEKRLESPKMENVTHNRIPTTKDNLRELMVAAVEKRLESPKMENVTHDRSLQDLENGDAVAGPSTSSLAPENLQISDSEEICMPSSAELFPDSTEIIPGTPNEKECSSQETIYSTVDEAPSCSFNSDEIFTDECDNNTDSQNDDPIDEQVQMSFLNRWPECCIPVPQLEPLENHSIMFSPHLRPGNAPRPYPTTYRDKWDFDHVRMPCSPLNKYPIQDLNGDTQIRSRWDLICRSLRRNIKSSYDLEKAIMQYNKQYSSKWSFRGLHAFFEVCLNEAEGIHFFENILPPMVDMALNLPNICTQAMPLLKKNRDHSLTLSQKQIGCLLLNAFFCTFPRRNVPSRQNREGGNPEYATYPDINFNRLYSGVRNKMPINGEKLKCLITYFRRITQTDPTGTVTFHRQCIRTMPRWHDSNRGIRTAVIRSDGLIETEGHGMLEVDFANKFVGGGVLGQGCVQEEIRFIICPELIISRLFVESLDKNEVLIIIGAEQYSKYSGYSNSFKFKGNFQDQTSRDAWGRRQTRIVAMDALNFMSTEDQFKLPLLEREINKAYTGFYEDAPPQNLTAVATGNWGCGAFKGSPSLKFLLQLMAASQTGRDLLYFTFGSKTLQRELQKIHNLVTEKNLSVGELWKLLLLYSSCVKVSNKEIHPKISDFLHSILSSKQHTEKDESSSLEITNSDKIAMTRLLKAVQEDSSTEIEDSDSPMNEHG